MALIDQFRRGNWPKWDEKWGLDNLNDNETGILVSALQLSHVSIFI